MANRPAAGPGLGALALVICLGAAIAALAVWVGRDLWDSVRRTPGKTGKAATVEHELRGLVGPLHRSGSRVSVKDRTAAEELAGRIRRLAREEPGRLEVVSEQRDDSRWRLTLRLGDEVYPVEIAWQEGLAPAQAGGGRVAFVIDDLGSDVDEARSFLGLEIPVTPAVIPHLRHSADVAALARERNREYLIHLPMEPQKYPEVNPGTGALLRSMTESQIRAAIGRAVASVPGAAGVNNHMGSRFTELREPLAWVMDELRARNLYFLDSVTSGKSTASQSAQLAGVPWARRDVFLDNEQSVEAVGRQIAEALKLAERTGSAIAIGHPHPATLEALKIWGPRIREAGVEVVPVGRLIQRPTG